MSEKLIVFYAINTDFLSICIKLIEKMYINKERCLLLCDNEEDLYLYNSKLWTYSKLSFIPHANKNTLSIDDAKYCNTWISNDIVSYNNPTVLLHNSLDISKLDGDISAFTKIIDIFNISLLDQVKQKSKFYENKGFLNKKLWIQDSNNWKSGEI